MKLTSKRLISVLICLAMVLAVLPVMAFAADTVTLYCQAPDTWETCNVYWWNGGTDNGWPGSAMEKGDDGIWYAEVPTDAANVIFNNGSGTQTTDLIMPTDENVMYVYGNGEWVPYGAAVEIVTNYYVAGVPELCGDNWVPNSAANLMTECADGTWSITYENVAAGTYKFKVTDGTWDNCWGDIFGDDVDGNYVLTVEELSNVTISFDPSVYIVFVDVEAVESTDPSTPPADDEGEVVIEETVNVTDSWNGAGPYSWVPTSNGKVTVTFDESACSLNWAYGIEGAYGMDLYWSDDTENGASYNVTAGEAFNIIVFAYDESTGMFTQGDVSFKVTFVSTGEGGGEVVTPDEPGDSQENPKIIGSSEWTFIGAGQTIWFCYDNTENMMFNGSYSQMLNISASTDYAVSYKEMDVPVDDDGYVNYEMFDMIMMGKYIFSVTNNGAEEAFFSISVSDKPEYINTYLNVELGETTVSLDASATYTLYEFQPEETGVYQISIPEDAGLVGDWGASFFPQDKTEDKTNTLTWTCTSVGQSVLIGISGYEAEVVLTIERTGDYVPAPEIEWTMVENTELDLVKDMVYTDENLVPIDVTDDVEDVIVFVDGLYRYGSATGPIVVANLDGAGLIGLYDAYSYGQLRYAVKDQDGVLTARYDCNEAMLEYLDAGIVPLTNELIDMLYNLGTSKGWYDAEIPGFYLFDATVNPETAYLGFCGYIEGTELTDEPVDPPVNPDEPEDPIPGTGDMGLGAVVVALMAATAGAVVLTKKKED